MATAAAGGVAAWRIHERTQPCWPVRQFVIFNRETQASLKAKTRFAAPGSYEPDSLPSAADYQAWLEGLQQRANNVTADGLSAHAQRAAALAQEFMQTSNKMNDEISRQDPLSPKLPRSAKAAAQISHEFGVEMDTLSRACPI
ncbi:hypothetical protein [Mycobacterium sp. 1245852.3]|uniref:hypothetical protein n=1 Tax=Mycobacterium sp. 1245852.3 TaxID=1856860 RepID=UPI001E60C18A|nr:hypothetical protein [Mycobacterium sp. 1245852.3]